MNYTENVKQEFLLREGRRRQMHSGHQVTDNKPVREQESGVAGGIFNGA